MIRSLRLAATAVAGSMLLMPQAGQAQQTIEDLGLTVTTTPAISSDYLFRGTSQTRNRPAASLTLDVQHDSGVYVGAFLSNVAFAGTNARQELDVLAGYRFALGPVNLDIGGIYYTYPGYDAQPGQLELNYFEAALKASYELDPLKFLGSVYYSPEFTAESGSSVYLEGGVDIALDFDFTFSARIGQQWIEDNARFGARDYMNYSVAASREVFAGFTLSLGYYGTDLDRRDCFGGAKTCNERLMAILSRPF